MPQGITEEITDQISENSEKLQNQNNSQPQNDRWFLTSKDQSQEKKWFLSERSKQILAGSDTWFSIPEKIPAVIKKASKRKKTDISQVEIKTTKDPELLKQYYDLREKEYRDYNGWSEYEGYENDFDRKSDIMLALENGKVLAGLRVSVPNSGYLSNENQEQNFTYKEICKSCDISLEGVKYIEVSAIVKDRNASNVLLGKMFDNVIKKCRSEDIKYIFGVSTQECNRDYRVTLKRIGVESVVLNQIEAPKKSKYNNASMSPIIIMP